MNASTMKDYFAKRCTYFKVILLTAIFGFALSMTLNASVNYSFASGDSNLMGGSDNDDDDGNDRDDFAGCSEKKLNKGYVNLCVSKKNNKVDKICVKQKKADKLLSDNDDDDDGHKHKNYYIPVTFYQDQDGDSYGSDVSVNDCLAPDGYVEDQGDCDDANAAINPGEADGCPVVDGLDNDCDSVVDNGVENIFTDNDGDGFGSASIVGCPGSPNTSLEGGDCDDTNADINPDAVEIACDSIDNDCNSQTADIVNTGVAYPDNDNDTYGSDDPLQEISVQCNIIPNGYVTNNIDCNDSNANVNPAQTEVSCNGIDDDCEADTSDNDSGMTVYLDLDGDGYGSLTSQIAFCGSIPAGYVENNLDCDDSEATTNPGASEICEDSIDNNCDGAVDENCGPVIGTITSTTTGRIWMDRNLGASQVATSSMDALAYGDLYQWGRGTDGHESRTSGTTSALSGMDQPGHGDFIVGSLTFNWRNPPNDSLWQGVNGINNPCPAGFRLPTAAEFTAENIANASGAFTKLKLPLAGRRNGNGALVIVGSTGYYWSSTVVGTNAPNNLFFNSSSANVGSSARSLGLSIRCLKD